MNIKRLFKRSNKIGESFMRLHNSKLYYMVLVLCVLGVGAIAVTVTVWSLEKQKNNNEMRRLVPEAQIKGNIIIDNGNTSIARDVPSINTAKSSQTAISANKKSSEQGAGQSVEAKGQKSANANISTAGVTSKSAKFARPVLGSIVKGFAMDKLVFSETLSEWTTHSGIDIACAKGTQVKTAYEGVVSEIKNDPRYGITIIIDHLDGLKTVYCGLASNDMVQVNQKVKKGDVIGGVGDTALFESKMEPHLHFEVWEDFQPVDPEKYLP